MTSYSQSELEKRYNILESHKLLGKFLDSTIINALVNLFDTQKNNINHSHKIINYIKEERRHKGLDDSNVRIISDVSGYDKGKSILCLDIEKNNKKFVHLSIHLALHKLDPQFNGMIHIVKDIYRKSKKKQFYALIYVNQPEDKPQSLVFTIADGYTTSNVDNSLLYDNELQQEMDVIISVLNKMFDENNIEFYIGNIYSENNRNKLYPIHNKTNIVLTNMNKHTDIFMRKNKGTMLNPVLSNSFSDKYRLLHSTTPKPKGKSGTRKLKKVSAYS